MTELTPSLRAAAFVAALAVVLVAALGIGRLVGPVDVEASTDHSGDAEHSAGPSAARSSSARAG